MKSPQEEVRLHGADATEAAAASGVEVSGHDLVPPAQDRASQGRTGNYNPTTVWHSASPVKNIKIQFINLSHKQCTLS
jgi:hypothetical protein